MLVALVLLLVWRVVLRPACRMLAPRRLGARLPQQWDRGPRAALRETFGDAGCVILLVTALAIGAVSHVAWDAFTHEGRAGVALIPALGASWGPLPGYKWLQYGSGIGGVIVLAIAAVAWLRRSTPGPVDPEPLAIRATWWLSLPVFLVAAVLLGLVAYGPLTAEFTVQHLGYRTLPLAAGVWALLTLVLVVVLRIRASRRPAA